MEVVKMLTTLAFLGVLALFVHLYKAVVSKPERIRSMLRKQGISGPPPSFLLGNIIAIKKALSTAVKAPTSRDPPTSHKYAAALFPFLDQWRKQYGDVFMFSIGNTQILYVNQPDAVKEITTCTSLDLGAPSHTHKEFRPLLGEGILTSNGALWTHQRKILAPELYMEKVKGMMNVVTEATVTLLNSWKSRIESEGGMADIKIDGYLRSFSGEVISRVCFGSNFSKGEEIFSTLRALQEVSSKKNLSTGVPGMRYLPTKNNRDAWRLEKEIRTLILKIVKEREEATETEKDLLQMVLEGAKNSGQEATDFIVDNCKNIYLAGYDTTAVAGAWCLMLLASNQEWQDRVRAEVIQVCGGQIPDADMLRKMKQLTMVIHESLRLYPPAPMVGREAYSDLKFGDIHVPKGVNLWTFTLTLHTDPKVWGPDADRFNPDRFANGITGACKLPHLYMPFGLGPRVCPGQHLAMAELKTLMAVILSNFSFILSPNYIHSPAFRLVMEPEHGVNLLVRKL